MRERRLARSAPQVVKREASALSDAWRTAPVEGSAALSSSKAMPSRRPWPDTVIAPAPTASITVCTTTTPPTMESARSALSPLIDARRRSGVETTRSATSRTPRRTSS